MASNELGHSKSSTTSTSNSSNTNNKDNNSSYFGKSANYHAQLTKSLFNNYNKTNQALQSKNNSSTMQQFNDYNQSQLLPDFIDFKQSNNNRQGNNNHLQTNNGYFTDRGAISVPSSRIETYYTNNTIEEEIQQIMQNHEDLHYFDQNSTLDTNNNQHNQNEYRYTQDNDIINEGKPNSIDSNSNLQNNEFDENNYNQQSFNESEFRQPQYMNQYLQQNHYKPQPQQQHYSNQYSQNPQYLNQNQQQNPQHHHNIPQDHQNSLHQSNQPQSHQNYNHQKNTSNQPQYNHSHYAQNYNQHQHEQGSAHNHNHNNQNLNDVPNFSSDQQTLFDSSKPHISQQQQPHVQQQQQQQTFEPKMKLKRGRPRKKPGFYLKLDGVNKKPTMLNRMISSSQSDSGTDYWNRTPSGGPIGISKLSFTPANHEDYDLKKEMDLNDNHTQNNIPAFNLTPSVEPPIGVQSYFELDHTPKNESLPGGGFFSPAITEGGNNNNINQFNQTFEAYLQNDPLQFQLPEFDENQPQSQHQQHQPQQHQQHQPPPQQQHQHQQNTSFTPLNFDVFDTVNQHDQTTSIQNDDYHSFDEDDLNPDFDQYTVSQYINPEDDNENKFSNLQKIKSNHSVNSATSEKFDQQSTTTTTPKTKKRAAKGAVCPICDKYISRDLTRHMRIHNEIGRFQCVYPKHMCNHKTQNFNRPYDYKKHLLHSHFKFDDPKGKNANTLGDKLPIPGACMACGTRFVASDWLSEHVLTKDLQKRCVYIEEYQHQPSTTNELNHSINHS
ncbi:hypothetical protein KGF54_000383 [Candida jiufengensis]|uniref:uncharacterized protein n=1 Tax=Candida jiufengensis TaxID=497108 RepID=UPI0022248355|nr:uncharacterized protein KGF54_000383 [Candida jiufengensis]KAI5956766.1 hypothetical protein KGF54_000383 [Candida jiufengensis]